MKQIMLGLGLLLIVSSARAESLQYICEKTRIDTIKLHNAMDALEQQIQQKKQQKLLTAREEQALNDLVKYVLINTQIYRDLSCYERGVK